MTTPTPDHEFVSITMAAGDRTRRRADSVRSAIAEGFDSADLCAVCSKQVSKQGQGPHMNAHKRLIGDAPPRPARKAKPKKRANKVMDEAAEAARLRKTDPVAQVAEAAANKGAPKKLLEERGMVAEMPPLFETLTGVLYGYAGDTIPTSMLAEVSEWMASTEHLINALTKETK